MTWAVRVDPERCIGSGMCLGVAPDLFHLVDGRSRPAAARIPAADQEAAMAAASCCPMEAIAIANAETGEPVFTADG